MSALGRKGRVIASRETGAWPRMHCAGVQDGIGVDLDF
jgi:hypothetical protein